jgi:hypothetical protein
LAGIGRGVGSPPARGFWWLVPAVLLAHLWLADALVPAQFGFGAGSTPPVRIEVAFVRELQPSAPPALPPVARAAARRAALPPRPAASAPAPEPVPESVTDPVPTPPAVEPAPPVVAADTPPAAAVLAERPPESLPAPGEPAAAAAAAASAPPGTAAAFEWPPSTRLSYRLSGNYRGPVEGQASVEWLASGSRYQVHLEVSVGPSFAPLFARRLSSDGAITADGLVPRRYDEETRVALREPRRLTIDFDGARVRLPGGADVAQPTGVQDSASQFVQLTWLFTMRPELLRAGHVIELPLALPRRVERWAYEVLASEPLSTPVGDLETVHVKPRREARPGRDLTAEFWVAPTLQNLPVRIIIRQDAETHVDLVLERLPQQAQR